MSDSTNTVTEQARRFGDDELPVDRSELRLEVQAKYAAVALTPTATFHFHTGRTIAQRCRYDMDAVDALPKGEPPAEPGAIKSVTLG